MSQSSSPLQKERHLAILLFKRAMLLALLIHLFGLVAVPNYEVRIRENRKTGDIEQIELPKEYFLPKQEKPAIQRPQIPIEAEEDEEIPDDMTISETILTPDTPVPEVVPILSFPDPGQWVPRDTEPVVIKMETPKYPDMAIRAQLEGEVRVRMLVDVDGRVKDVIIDAGRDIFHEAVIEAAYSMLFEPATFNNNQVAVWVAMRFDFILEDHQ